MQKRVKVRTWRVREKGGNIKKKYVTGVQGLLVGVFFLSPFFFIIPLNFHFHVREREKEKMKILILKKFKKE
jgi:hypothetical protein